jgi:type II secretory pathway pseudopilin PulG
MVRAIEMAAILAIAAAALLIWVMPWARATDRTRAFEAEVQARQAAEAAAEAERLANTPVFVTPVPGE